MCCDEVDWTFFVKRWSLCWIAVMGDWKILTQVLSTSPKEHLRPPVYQMCKKKQKANLSESFGRLISLVMSQSSIFRLFCGIKWFLLVNKL